ncbi:hypothetical protein BGZ59_010036 [Podila verticillata]|nr:hypothetical protein BGZ59_010036 [Podila verticillata]
MWNDPDLDQRHPRAKSREENKIKELKEQLTAFGYESYLFRNDGVAEAIEHGQLLITWQGQDPSDPGALWLDRYDARNLLDDQRYFSGPRDILDENLIHDPHEEDVDDERYLDLDSDEELLFDMDEDEREEHLARKRESRGTSQYKGIRYDYDQDQQAQEPEFQLHFEVPEGMAVILALIERTAKFVNNSSEPTMEIILQAKQATNANFAFMSRRHHLFQFYKHVRYLMQTGLYEYEEEVRQREEEDAKAEEEARQAALVTTVKEALHVDVQKVIEETAEFVARNSDPVFLEKLRSKDDRRFAFLSRDHLWHGYYQWKLEEAQAAFAKPSDRSSELTDTPGKGAAEAQVSECPVSQEQNITAEMQKLARLQKIREMFKLKQKASQDATETSPESGHLFYFQVRVEVEVEVDVSKSPRYQTFASFIAPFCLNNVPIFY